jgi:hypothetical protein
VRSQAGAWERGVWGTPGGLVPGNEEWGALPRNPSSTEIPPGNEELGGRLVVWFQGHSQAEPENEEWYGPQ